MKNYLFNEMENVATCATDESVLFHMYSKDKPVHDYVNAIFKIYLQELVIRDSQTAINGDINAFSILIECIGDVEVNLPEPILNFYEQHIVEDVPAIIENANKCREAWQTQ